MCSQIRFHKSLSNPEILRIVHTLLDGEMSQCDIFSKMGLGQSTVSVYLSQLVRAGLLDVRRDCQKKMYSISGNVIIDLL